METSHDAPETKGTLVPTAADAAPAQFVPYKGGSPFKIPAAGAAAMTAAQDQTTRQFFGTHEATAAAKPAPVDPSFNVADARAYAA